MIAGRQVVAAVLTLLAAGAAAADAARPRDADERVFPHLAHARLFPSCAGCHAAIADSADPGRAARAGRATASERFPPAELCAECPTERERPVPAGRAPDARATNLAFAHDTHARAQLGAQAPGADGTTGPLDCTACHAPPGDTRRMAVARAQPATCVGCHAHRATAHLADDSPCATCHVPLVSAKALPAARVAGLPRPPSHETPEFIRNHGRLGTSAPTDASCAVCHASESCARCHVNADALPRVVALGRDARVAALVAGRAAAHPAPATHADPSWPTAHGASARRATASCANCHAQRSCATCHLPTGTGDRADAASVIARLPAPAAGAGAQGVRLPRARGPADAPPVAGGAPVPAAPPARTQHLVRVHPPDFAREHDAAAGAQSPRCAGCHAQRFCAGCHAGEGRRRFHPPDFAVRHAPAAYGRERDCASCHSAEAFCRACHASGGLASRGRRDVAFHDAQPQWLVQHGRAARQGMESCTTCHGQRDCMQCHSSRGLRVNPHGPGFDARRMAARSRVACIACHGRDPLSGG